MSTQTPEMRNKITVTREEALAYHEFPHPGKTGIAITVPTASARDLSLAYTPGTFHNYPVWGLAFSPPSSSLDSASLNKSPPICSLLSR